MTLTKEILMQTLTTVMQNLELNKERLNQADTTSGNYGTVLLAGLRDAYKAVVGAISGPHTLVDTLSHLGAGVSKTSGSSSSALTGMLFTGMARTLQSSKSDVLDGDGVIRMFEGALDHMRTATRAFNGDKSMLYALIPAVGAMSGLRGTDSSAREVFIAGAGAVRKLISNLGKSQTTRSPYGGDGGGGTATMTAPPKTSTGAITLAYILEAFANASRQE